MAEAMRRHQRSALSCATREIHLQLTPLSPQQRNVPLRPQLSHEREIRDFGHQFLLSSTRPEMTQLAKLLSCPRVTPSAHPLLTFSTGLPAKSVTEGPSGPSQISHRPLL